MDKNKTMFKTDTQLKQKEVVRNDDTIRNPITILCYGTLRRGFYNHFRMGNNRYLGTVNVSGYKMYTNSYYPAIVKSNNINDVIIAEIYEIDKGAFHPIVGMELGAGYYMDEIEVSIGGEKIVVPAFVMEQSRVDNGNWKLISNGEFK